MPGLVCENQREAETDSTYENQLIQFISCGEADNPSRDKLCSSSIFFLSVQVQNKVQTNMVVYVI